MKILDRQIEDGCLLNHRLIFKPPMTEYDFLIKMRLLLIPRRLQAINLNRKHPEVDWHPFKQHSEAKIPVVGFDPVQIYLQELRVSISNYYLTYLLKFITIL